MRSLGALPLAVVVRLLAFLCLLLTRSFESLSDTWPQIQVCVVVE